MGIPHSRSSNRSFRAYHGVVTTAKIALTGAAARTVLQLVASSTNSVRITGFGVYFDSIDPVGQPVHVRLLRQTTAGTASAGTIVSANNDVAATKFTTTAQHSATVEPTSGDLVKAFLVHPQQGYEFSAPDDERTIYVAKSTRLGIECTAPASVNVVAWIEFKELNI